MTEPRTHTVDAPGATITYDVREADGEHRAPILMMIGSPMDASGFASLAGHFRDRTVVTYDPRGVGAASAPTAPTESTPDQHADDLHRVIADLGAGPVDLFASSGGAVNALALVARHPEQVRRSSRTSRRPPRRCRTASRRWPRRATSTRPTCARAPGRRWRSSSR